MQYHCGMWMAVYVLRDLRDSFVNVIYRLPHVSASHMSAWYRKHRTVLHNFADTCRHTSIRRAYARIRMWPQPLIYTDRRGAVRTTAESCTKSTQQFAVFKTWWISADCRLRNRAVYRVAQHENVRNTKTQWMRFYRHFSDGPLSAFRAWNMATAMLVSLIDHRWWGSEGECPWCTSPILRVLIMWQLSPQISCALVNRARDVSWLCGCKVKKDYLRIVLTSELFYVP